MLLLLVLAQSDPAEPPSWIIGPYGLLIGAIIAIGWLARRLSIVEREKAEMTERLIAQQEKSIPLLERVASSLESRA